LDQHWDVIVVGTGMGGGLLGRALAERGLSVLFVEKGLAGWRTEEAGLDAGIADPVARAIRGAWPEPLEVTQDGLPRTFFAPLGSGVGGSSVFYAATLERPEPRDLDDHPSGAWPVSHAAMRPWFERAEAMLAVEGEADPLSSTPVPTLRAPPPPGPADAAIMARLRANGMHPYRLHAGLRRLPGCAECLGRKCPRACKMDGRSAGVEPALATGRAGLLTGCEALRLVGTASRVTGIEARRGGEALTLRAPRIVLAAGALSTPRLLLASTGEAWPGGCGNGAGLVGCHLMLHLNETFAVWPGAGDHSPSKAVGLRDLMVVEGRRMGMVQAMGVDAREPEILHYMRERLAARPLGRTRLAREGARLPARIATGLLGTAKLFVGLLEDFPDAANRVTLDPARPSRIVATYAVPAELRARRALFRRAIGRAFRGLRPVFLHQAPEPNWGHACGTTRMGLDPATSVVDASCRVHGIENLWVADAGVFPTSMGVNPSLAIAANALRVADAIAREAGR